MIIRGLINITFCLIEMQLIQSLSTDTLDIILWFI